MYPNKDRVETLLEAVLKEMQLLAQMSIEVKTPDDYVSSTHGLILFRACGMSIQYITENFVKIRNLCGADIFTPYKSIPWKNVFGMRNFLSHEYGDVDAEGIFNTVKTNIPELQVVTERMLEDLHAGKLDIYLS
ncbi:MAG: DUF86 domain-containing protein [Bacteroidales bacterium]|nr:DUF86 domain-containing protein [Bacteroidales bacterium]